MSALLMILVGVPAVGKTSFARDLLERYGVKNTQLIHVCYDLLLPQRELVNTEENQWKKDRLEIEHQVEIFLQDISENKRSSLANQYFFPGERKRVVIVIDDNMYYKSMRLRYYRLAQTYQCGFCQMYFETELPVALVANSRRPELHRVPESIIRNIFTKLEPPNLSNNWERNTLVVKHFGDYHLEPVSQMLEAAFSQPETMPSVPSEPPIQVFNINHAADGILRKIVSRRVEVAKEKLPRKEFLNYTQALMKAKSFLLSDVKGGKVDLSLENNLEQFLENVFEKYLS